MEEKIIEFINSYNGFEGLYIRFDYLAMKTGEICIESQKYNPIVKSYADGGKIRQYIFSVCMKEARTPVTHESISNIGIMNGFLQWVNAQGKEGNFPLFGRGTAMEALSDVETKKLDHNNCIYRVRLKYTYYTEE